MTQPLHGSASVNVPYNDRVNLQFDIFGNESLDVEDPQSDGQLQLVVRAEDGVRVTRWVTWHGVALNVEPDLSHFSGIIPCGVAEHGVTSLHKLGISATMAEADVALRQAWDEVFGHSPAAMQAETCPISALPASRVFTAAMTLPISPGPTSRPNSAPSSATMAATEVATSWALRRCGR